MTVACSIALAVVAGAAAPPHGAFPYPIHQRTLENGVQVVFVPQPTPGLVAYFTLLRVGSRNEVEPGRSGFAHFFEHLTFRGTKAHSGDDWNRITSSLGLESNAFTDDDLTAYWLAGPSSALPTIVELEADRFMNVDFGEDDFKVESRAVLGELLKDMASPDFKVQEAGRDLAFTRHTYKHTTMGFEKDVRSMPGGYQYALELYRRFYRPDNATVLVVGDFDEEEVFELVRRHYGPWRGKGEAPRVEPEPPQTQERQARLSWATPILPRVWTIWHAPGADDLDATAAQLLLWPLLFGRPSRLYRDLVLDRHLVEDMGGEFQPHRDPYLFGVELVLKGTDAEAPARAAIDRAIADVAAGKIDERLLADVKANVLATLVMQSDTPYRTGVWLAYYTALQGDPGYLDAVMSRVERVTGDDLVRFARRWLVPHNRTTVVVATGKARPAVAGGDR